MVGKQKSSTRALRIHNWQVLSATLGHCYSQYYRCFTELLADKLVKEQSLVFFNSKFTACVILKEPPFFVSVTVLIINIPRPRAMI